MLVSEHCFFEKPLRIPEVLRQEPEGGPSAFFRSGLLMARLAEVIRQEEGRVYAVLPFCHTVEAESLGAAVCYGDGLTAPRVSAASYESPEDILLAEDFRLDQGRLGEVLKACALLSGRGIPVMLNVCGPLTILNSLMDAQRIYRGIHRQPRIMIQLLSKIRFNLLRYIEAALQKGVSLISYADSAGAVDILGNRLAGKILDWFTLPFLKELEPLTGKGRIVHLCPKTTKMLLGAGKIRFEAFVCEEELSYEESLYSFAQRMKKGSFFGQRCINGGKEKLEGRKLQKIIFE